jgi:DedD protein
MAEKKEDARSENVDALKRRGRRRLVGAIALVLAAVIVLPMIFDSEPRQSAPPVSVRIPPEDATGFTPKVTPKTPAIVEPAKPKADPKPEAVAKPEPAPEPKPEARPEPKPEGKPGPVAAVEPKPEPEKARVVPPEERAKAEAALSGGQFLVPVGAYADPSAVVAQLKDARIQFYTEPVAIAKGTVTRVRAGPYVTQAEAEKAAAQIQALGLKPGKILTKP